MKPTKPTKPTAHPSNWPSVHKRLGMAGVEEGPYPACGVPADVSGWERSEASRGIIEL